MKYDYGIEEQGFSYEYYNIYLPLCDIYGKENVFLFDYIAVFKQSGKEGMNKKLKEIIKSEKPEVSLFCLFTDQFEEDILTSLKEITKTVVYFFDDPWRKEFVRHWIKYFDYFSTPDFYMYQRYKLEGINNVIYSPFGFNKNVYKKLDLPVKYDVSFVGGYSPLRGWIMKNLKKEGVKVEVFGTGWGSGIKRITQEEMVWVFNQSKINLNLSNAIYKDINFLFWSLKSLENIRQLAVLKKTKEQVKGRHFEINACGGFQLSYFIPGLNTIYEIDREIAAYESIDKIPELIEFFLEDQEMRESIAENGYRRSIEEHTAQAYLQRLVEQVVNYSLKN